jgi:hypothetical protein
MEHPQAWLFGNVLGALLRVGAAIEIADHLARAAKLA